MSEYRIVVDFNGGQQKDGSYESDFAKMVNSGGAVAETSAAASQTFAMPNAFSALTDGMGNAFAGLLLVKEAEKIGRQVFSNEIQRVGRYTGSSQAQDVANATLSLIGMIKSPIESAIAYHYEREQREYERNWESIGLDLARERGGVSLNRSRSEG